jgi:tRNA-2-methylthio-N6-dimethylallyladenosine synthase
MNVLDSQLVEGQLRELGLAPVTRYDDAEVILFNTCSVRQHAEDKVLSRLGTLRAVKRRKPETVIGVIGCMAEREKEGLFAKAPHIDLLCGPGDLNRLPGLLADVWQRHAQVTALAGSLSRRTEVMQRALEYDSVEALDMSRAPGDDENVLQSYIRVQRGCDKFCTYCVVPFTRGPERSRPAANIVEEARMLAERGCREITLLGQTVNSYVHQEDGRPVRFAELLERVHAVEGLDRIRFVTSFPADWDEDIFRVMRDHPRIMPYLHIPAQSGSDAVLRRMRRTYSAASYLKLMDAARKYVPGIALAGDFIVGFCGETDADFAASIDLVRRVEYKNIFVFKYSPRPGTAADRNLADDIPDTVKNDRCNELLAVQAEISARQKAPLVGRTFEVLVEGFSKMAAKLAAPGESAAVFQESEQDRGREALRPGRKTGWAQRSRAGGGAARRDPQTGRMVGQLVGRTPHDQIVVFDGDESLIGALVEVRIERTTALTLVGVLTTVRSSARRAAASTVTADSAARPGIALRVLTP